MRVLCLDTSTATVVVALVDVDQRTWIGRAVEGRAQGVLELADELLNEAGDRTFDAVVVGVGPGGFTGLRVGITTARGLAQARNVPLFGVASLLVVAAPSLVDAAPGTVVRANVDARRGERFVQDFSIDAAGAIESLGAAVAIGATAADPPSSSPTVDGLALAALQVLERSDSLDGDPMLVLPDYVRAPDATPPRLEFSIDALRRSDLDALLELERRCFPTPWTRSMYAGEFDRPERDCILLAARDVRGGGRLLGAALGARIGDSWHLMNILVDPAARRRGVAARLVTELLQRGDELGVEEGWTLEVRAGNDGAIDLYESFGFERCGVRPGYYADTREDAVVMWRDTTVQPAHTAGDS